MQQTSLSAWLRKPKDLGTPKPPVSSSVSPTLKQPKHSESYIRQGIIEEEKNSAPIEPSIASEKSSSGSNRFDASKSHVVAPTQTQTSRHPALTSLPTNLPNLPPNVEFVPLTTETITSFRRLNALLLPIPYPEKFYIESLNDEVANSITLLARWHPAPSDDSTLFEQHHNNNNKKKEEAASRTEVGMKSPIIASIRCRILPTSPPSGNSRISQTPPTLYISTLTLLSPYRGFGIASALLHIIEAYAIDTYGVGSVTAHVWEANDEGLEWYVKRGFREVGREQDYYRRLKPRTTAVLMKKVISDEEM
jgi:N-alpha-acetyltransferase 50